MDDKDKWIKAPQLETSQLKIGKPDRGVFMELASRIGLLVGALLLLLIIFKIQGGLYSTLVNSHCGVDSNPIGLIIYLFPHVALASSAMIVTGYLVYKFYQSIKCSSSWYTGLLDLIGIASGGLLFLTALSSWSMKVVARVAC